MIYMSSRSEIIFEQVHYTLKISDGQEINTSFTEVARLNDVQKHHAFAPADDQEKIQNFFRRGLADL